MIKASGDEGVEVYHKLCTKIWKSEQCPSDWKRAIFITLPKKGDLLMCSNYRTISLISHASKILLNVLLKRMENKLEEEVSNAQAGFRKNRGTRDRIFNLRMIIQKYREINASLHTFHRLFESFWLRKPWTNVADTKRDERQPETYKPHQITVWRSTVCSEIRMWDFRMVSCD